MKTIQKIIYSGFAACALASASMPAFSWHVSPSVDFEWYANVGKPVVGYVEVAPAPRAYLDGKTTTFATGPLELRDRDGNVIPVTPEAYPIDSTRR